MGIIVPSSEGPERPFTFLTRQDFMRQTLLAGISLPRVNSNCTFAVADAIEPILSRRGSRNAPREIADHLLKAGSFAKAPNAWCVG